MLYFDCYTLNKLNGIVMLQQPYNTNSLKIKYKVGFSQGMVYTIGLL